MSEKLYYWANNLKNYSTDNDIEFDQVIEIKRLNFFIGKNNSGKSRFLRQLFQTSTHFKEFQKYDFKIEIKELIDYLEKNNFRRPGIFGVDSSWSTDGTSPVSSQEKFQIITDLSTLNSFKFNFDELKKQISGIRSTTSSYKLASSNLENDKLNIYLKKIENKISRIELQQ